MYITVKKPLLILIYLLVSIFNISLSYFSCDISYGIDCFFSNLMGYEYCGTVSVLFIASYLFILLIVIFMQYIVTNYVVSSKVILANVFDYKKVIIPLSVLIVMLSFILILISSC